MGKQNTLSNVWIKASILGANWAASEIILGSFLHNIHIPFKGSILTAIALILMISVAYRWKDKGLFWRSGLICALMKTMSPSAVIFGPMVAILVEALLLEASVRILGRNIGGFILGATLAMSWVLVQRIANYIIYYGFNIVEIYADILKYAEKQLHIQFDIFWLPILILLGLYILFGLIAVFMGVRIGKELANHHEETNFENLPANFDLPSRKRRKFPYSISWLIINLAGLITVLILISNTPLYLWMPVSLVFITVWVLRYKRAMRQLSRPKFWIFFVVITVLSAMLITSFTGSENNWLDGLMVGLQMNFRAAVVIIGFTVLGTELYNPIIRNYLADTAFKQLPIALELAFESLPFVIGHLPDARTFLKKPGKVIKLLFLAAEVRFNDLKRKQQAKVLIINGDISEGKTTFLIELIRRFQTEKIAATGFYSPRIMQESKTVGYDIVNIETGETFAFLRLKNQQTSESIGKYGVVEEGLRKGKKLLSMENIQNNNTVVIDEIGKLELEDKGWSNKLIQLLGSTDLVLILTLRTDFVDQVIAKFNILNAAIFTVSKVNSDEIIDFIRKHILAVKNEKN